jgi:ketosteroid isomerase-like protein
LFLSAPVWGILAPGLPRRLIVRSAWIACLALACTAAIGQDAPPPGVRGGGLATATRSVARYTDLERSLQDALQAHDAAAVRRLLSEDFEVREPELADAIPGADWLHRWMSGSLRAYRIDRLEVREFGDSAVVSFLLYSQGRLANAALPAAAYVVDVWRKGDDKLAVRYVSVPAKAPPRPAGPNRRG